MNIVDAIQKIRPGAEWVIYDNSYDKLVWHDTKQTKPTIEEIDEAIRLYDYIELRKKEYPPVQEQLDLLFHQGYEEWKKKIQQIKDKYPKGI